MGKRQQILQNSMDTITSYPDSHKVVLVYRLRQRGTCGFFNTIVNLAKYRQL
jgi:hypothetical protein